MEIWNKNLNLLGEKLTQINVSLYYKSVNQVFIKWGIYIYIRCNYNINFHFEARQKLKRCIIVITSINLKLLEIIQLNTQEFHTRIHMRLWSVCKHILDPTFTELLLISKTNLTEVVHFGSNWSLLVQLIFTANPKSGLIWSCSPI